MEKKTLIVSNVVYHPEVKPVQKPVRVKNERRTENHDNQGENLHRNSPCSKIMNKRKEAKLV